MPVHLRKFYYNKLIDIKEKENEAAKGSSTTAPPSIPKMPNFNNGKSSKVKMQ